MIREVRKRRNISIQIIFLLLVTLSGSSQDIHLSQYDANPLYLNPALTGVSLNNNQLLKANLGYRNQKLNVPGYLNSTVLFGLDIPLSRKFAIGQQMFNNNINSIYSTTNVMFSAAYNISNKNPHVSTLHNLIVGLQFGFIQKNFNLGNFSFDAQYNSLSTQGFDTNLPSGENLGKANRIDFDANMGMFYKYSGDTVRVNPYFGFAVHHLTQPDQSVSNVFSATPMRFTVHGGCAFKLNKRLIIEPRALYLNQAKAEEVNVGIMGYDKLNDSSNYETMLGFAWRVWNSYIVHLGMRYKSVQFRVSYDINSSLLKTFGNNGVEFSIAYTVAKKKKPTDVNEKVARPVKEDGGKTLPVED